MRIHLYWFSLLVLGVVFTPTALARRVRVQPQENVEYYDDPQEEEQRQVVLVSSADQYNGLYGQPTAASSRSAQDNFIPSSSRSKSLSATTRTKETPKQPPVQTIRNYNKVNDDGSFTFGYEAADGSFKEETRGTDCVVRGKYGYIDPDGNKREFTYVSGNPCDPNAPKEQDTSEEESAEDENVPANYPSQRPIRPIARPVTVAPKPAVTLFQNDFEQNEEEQPVPEQILRPQQPTRRPTILQRPQYIQPSSDIYQRAQLIPSTTPASVLYRQSVAPITITPRPRPVSPTPSARTQLPATTYRPQLLQVTVTPRPSILYSKQLQSPSTTAATKSNIDFDAEFQKFQQENNLLSPTPSSLLKTTPKSPNPSTQGQIYSSALVFDPSSGQYKTQLYQTLPQTEGDFSLDQRIQPFVQPSAQPRPFSRPSFPSIQPNGLYTRAQQNQAAYQQQQAELQFQNSAQLFAQQQRARLQQQQQQQQQSKPQATQQPVYYIQPSIDQSSEVATGQIDAFLRGHNIQF